MPDLKAAEWKLNPECTCIWRSYLVNLFQQIKDKIYKNTSTATGLIDDCPSCDKNQSWTSPQLLWKTQITKICSLSRIFSQLPWSKELLRIKLYVCYLHIDCDNKLAFHQQSIITWCFLHTRQLVTTFWFLGSVKAYFSGERLTVLTCRLRWVLFACWVSFFSSSSSSSFNQLFFHQGQLVLCIAQPPKKVLVKLSQLFHTLLTPQLLILQQNTTTNNRFRATRGQRTWQVLTKRTSNLWGRG